MLLEQGEIILTQIVVIGKRRTYVKLNYLLFGNTKVQELKVQLSGGVDILQI